MVSDMRYIQNNLTKYKIQQEFMADYESMKSKFYILDEFNKFYKFVAHPTFMAD